MIIVLVVVVYIVVLADHIIKMKDEKIEKYLDLVRELKNL